MKIILTGHSQPILQVRVGPVSCGSITDGVAFAHGTEGSWVMRFNDLQRVYRAACKARKMKP